MRKSKFSAAELKEFEHEKLGKFYIPKLTFVQLLQFLSPVIEFSEYLAKEFYQIDKDFYEQKPVRKLKKQHVSMFWGDRPVPSNQYEQKVYESMTNTAGTLMLTMFLCNDKGECICPFTERMGQDISNERQSLYEELIVFNPDKTLGKRISALLLGKDYVEETESEEQQTAESIYEDEVEAKEVESPNEQSPKKKSSKVKAN